MVWLGAKNSYVNQYFPFILYISATLAVTVLLPLAEEPGWIDH